MAKSPFKDKRDSMAKYRGVEKHVLKGIKDGYARVFIDDGPFPKTADGQPVDGWKTKTAQSGRAEFLKKILQRVADPLHGERGDDPEAEVPAFVWDSEGPPPKVWDSRTQLFMSPVVMTPHLKKVMEHFIKERNAVMDQARAQVEAKKREAEAKAEEGLNAILGKLGEAVAKQAPAKKSAPGGAA